MNWIAFIHKLQWKDIPDDARHQAKRCLLDAVGSAIAGRQTELSRIIHDFVVSMYGGKGCHL
ncbi:MAG: MmgE/PrpD family protein, partial [Proteobacteria bacterium]|nr:MmgE/PrpD family protein [Pseudomonadota bacterium]